MPYKNIEIKTELELPYKIIDLKYNSGTFCFYFSGFDEGQTDYSVKMGGITGKFGIELHEKDFDTNFICDTTVENVFYFYRDFKKCYETLSSEAVLSDYSNKHTNIAFAFDKFGHCNINGFARNIYSGLNIALQFKIKTDQSFIPAVLDRISVMFDEFARLQGNTTYINRCDECGLYKCITTDTCPECNGIMDLDISEVSLSWKCRECSYGIATTANKLCVWDNGKYPKECYNKLSECKYAETKEK